MIEPHQFQQQASATIVQRFQEYVQDPVVTGTEQHLRRIPFFQALSSITASGKTVILADAVSEIAQARPVPPVVLWLSKGKVVVEQSYANLLPGGKYHHLLGDMEVRALAEYDADEVSDVAKPMVFFATVGTFNQKDKEEGTRLIYRCDIDTAEQSTWDALKERLDPSGAQRPLIVVYDEAHNLSDQQVDLLMELNPLALLLASATMRHPARLEQDIEHLRESGWGDDWLVTAVDAKAVADSGLVKSTVVLGGYKAPMEDTVGRLLGDLKDAERDAAHYGVEGRPKAIYVCNTNIVEGDANRKDDPKQPFGQRQAPPILIWRYLTEQHGIDPNEIAVYCTLRFDKHYPPPDGFRHFKGRERDYEAFVAGDYHHVIFNLSLQEGWDDPFCYFAYIDKSMDSRVQVEQIIGRLLRQPGAHHFPAERLNTAHFYIRVDRNQVFNEVLDRVSRKLVAEAPELKVIKKGPGKPPPTEYQPSEPLEVPGMAVKTEDAIDPVQELIEQLSDYRHDDGTDTKAQGARVIVKRKVGVTDTGEPEWEELEESSRVLARWIFTREVRHRHVGALGIAPTSDGKFDAGIGIGSKAETHIKQVAEQVVDAYVEHAYLAQKTVDPYVVGPLLVCADDMTKFQHSLHAGYDDLNPFEREFAEALDKAEVPWVRNPPRTGYGIPLVSLGPTTTFFPDFLAWKGKHVVAIDTKGGHLLPEATARKLVNIEYPSRARRRVVVRFVSEGRYTKQAEQESSEGYTIFGIRSDGTRKVAHVSELALAIPKILRP